MVGAITIDAPKPKMLWILTIILDFFFRAT
jgi:hypothetical protein